MGIKASQWQLLTEWVLVLEFRPHDVRRRGCGWEREPRLKEEREDVVVYSQGLQCNGRQEPQDTRSPQVTRTTTVNNTHSITNSRLW